MAIVPLEGSNYPMWKVQCWMALVKDGLWSIVNGMETILDKRVAIRVLGLWQGEIELWLSSFSVATLPSRGSSRTSFNRRRWLTSWSSIFTEVERGRFRSRAYLENDGKAVIDDPVKEEDCVVHLLASFPEAYSMLVTAIEASSEVP